ncbi:unnamed protein product, partial [Symbiodinium sp. KB8]
PTFARSFLSSLAFAKYTVSLKVPDEIFSPKVDHVRKLEAIATGSIEMEPPDRAAGALQCDLSETSDGTVGYLEGIGEVAWGVPWFEFCKQYGPPRGSGRYLLIRAGCDRSSVEVLGTHSLKATTLSWCAKFGLDRATRAALGYHSKGRDGTELIYGRDNMAKPVRDLQEVLLQVALGKFDPDATRSGYFVKRGGPPGGEAIPQEEVLSESSSEASEDAEGVDHEAAENAADELGRQWEPDQGLREELTSAILPEVGNLRRLAFISSFTPGQTDEGPLMEVLQDILKRDLTISDKANWRAVYNEAFAIVTAEMKQRIEKADPEATVRPLSQPERSERYERQAKKLVGISLKGPLEPSDALVDLAVASYEAELAGEKKKDVRFTVEESSGKLKIEQKQPDLVADTSSEILVQQALTRRALAMDQANLLEFNVMDQWTQRIMKARIQAPAENFSKPTWKQLESADRQLFSELRDKTRTGVQTTGAGRPLDSLLPDAMYMNEVSCLLQPFPMPASREIQVRPEVPKMERPSPYGRGGGKGKGKHKTRFMTRLPPGLEGGCATKGQKCDKGLHICAAWLILERRFIRRVVDSPPDSVECHRSEIVDREDHQCHHEGSEGASLGKSGVSDEAPRSRSPRVSAKDAKVQIGSDQLEVEEMASEVLRIFDELPSDILRRGQNNASPAAKSYATGAYVLGGNVGLKANASARPEVLRTLARFIRRCAPEFRFTSINVFEEVRTERHKDQWNANLHNLAIPITKFAGGAIFVEHAGGRDVSRLNGERGTRLLVSNSPVAFNARHCWHYTEEWRGRRVIVVAYSVRHFHSLSKEHRKFLLDCDVHLPVDAPEDIHLPPVQVLAFPPSKPKVASQGEPGRPLKPSTSLFLDIKCGSGLLAARLRKDGFQVVSWSLLHPARSQFWERLNIPVDAAGVAAGKQPKLSKYQPQIEEFKCQAVVQEFPWPLPVPLDDKGNLRVAVGSIPAGSRLLRVTSKQGVVAAKKSDAAAGKPLSVTFGIYRTDHEFMSQALHLDHPFDLCVAVPDFMRKALAFTLKE